MVVPIEGRQIDLASLQTWCEPHMPKYHIPRQLITLTGISKNAMGKVNKKQLLNQLFPSQT